MQNRVDIDQVHEKLIDMGVLEVSDANLFVDTFLPLISEKDKVMNQDDYITLAMAWQNMKKAYAYVQTVKESHSETYEFLNRTSKHLFSEVSKIGEIISQEDFEKMRAWNGMVFRTKLSLSQFKAALMDKYPTVDVSQFQKKLEMFSKYKEEDFIELYNSNLYILFLAWTAKLKELLDEIDFEDLKPVQVEKFINTMGELPTNKLLDIQHKLN